MLDERLYGDVGQCAWAIRTRARRATPPVGVLVQVGLGELPALHGLCVDRSLAAPLEVHAGLAIRTATDAPLELFVHRLDVDVADATTGNQGSSPSLAAVTGIEG